MEKQNKICLDKHRIRPTETTKPWRCLVLSKTFITNLVYVKNPWYSVLSQAIWHRLNMLMDILGRTKFQGTFGMAKCLLANKDKCFLKLCLLLLGKSILFSLSAEDTMWKARMKEAQAGILPGKISITSDMQMTPLLWQKVKKKWKPLDEVKVESEKVGLKLNIQKTKITASSPTTSWQTDGETMETDRLCFLGHQNHYRWWLQS